MWTGFFVAISYLQKDSSQMFELEVLVICLLDSTPYVK